MTNMSNHVSGKTIKLYDEIKKLRTLLRKVRPIVWSNAEAYHMFDGFKRKTIPHDALVKEVDDAIGDAPDCEV